DSNKHQLVQSEADRLNEWLAANANSKILAINGYTDEDGSIGLNDTLAQRRVSTVFGLIKDKVKIREDFRTRSFGKLHKQSPIKAENRRVTIYYLQEKDLAKENEVLGISDEKFTEPKYPVPMPEEKPVVYPSKIAITTPDGKKQEIKLDVEFMKAVGQAKPGQKLTLKNLNFYENSFAVVPESRPKMYELLEVMKLHPKLKIKVEGHVCCMTADRRNLSRERAKAIVLFLHAQGIARDRMTFEGFGVSQPIYPIPEKSEEQAAANRRVEILVVEN
ncbi:MAG TPA: OmpA family protein, partial [Flavobacterium sp.]|nr:OmpA family protein [Flavobacterium sp.]